jgi:hypothetical protein
MKLYHELGAEAEEAGRWPTNICFWAAISRNLTPIESAICEQRRGKVFGQPAAAGVHLVCWHKRKYNIGGVFAVMVNQNLTDLAVPENNFGLAGLQVAGKVWIERAGDLHADAMAFEDRIARQ